MEPSVETKPKGTATKGPRLDREPRGLRQRTGPRDPDHRARVRRLRHGVDEVPRGGDPRGQVHRVPPEAGRLRPAPARRPDDPREAAVRRHHAGADRGVRGPGRAVHAAPEGSHHDPPELPVPPHPASRRGQGDPHDLRGGPLQPRGLRQHRAQRDRRPVGGRQRRRGLRPDPVRRARSSATSCATRSASCSPASSRSPSRPTTRTSRSPRSTTSASCPGSARSTASPSRASRFARAAAPRSWRASAARSGTSPPSTTAST